MKTQELSQRVRSLLATAGVTYREVEHEGVYDYEKAEEIRQKFGLRGVESKSLFLKTKDGRWFIFVTVQGQRLDSKAMKRLVGSPVSVATDQELIEKTGCEPGCAVPFGHGVEIGLIVDQAVYGHERFIFSPGPPTETMEIASADIPRLLSASPCPVLRYENAGGAT